MKKILRRTLIVLLGLTVVAALVLLSAPCLLEAFVLPRLLARAGLPEKSVEIWELTPSRLLGSVDLHDGDRPLLTIPRLEIGYTPGSLLRRRLTRLVLDHATLHLEMRNGRPALPTSSEEPPAQSNTAGALLLSPLAVEEVVFESCSLILHEPGQPDLRVGLTGRSSQQFFPAGGDGYGLRSLNGTFGLTDGISAAGGFSLAAGENLHTLELNLDGGRLPALDRFLPTGLDSSMFGTLSLTSTLKLSAPTFTLEHVEANGSLRRFHPVFAAGFEGSGAGADETLEFIFSGPPEKMTYNLSGLRLTRPLILSATLHGSAAVSGDGAFRIDGAIDSVLDGVLLAGGKEGIAVLGTYNAVFSAERFEAGLSLTSRPPPLGGTETPVEFSAVSASAQLVRRGNRLSAHFSGTIPELSLPSRELTLKDIVLELPVELNARPENPGSFSIGAVSLNGAGLLTLASSITQEGETFRIDGSTQAPFDPELKTVFTGTMAPLTGGAELSWNLPETDLSSSSLPPALGIPETVSFNTRLAADGTIGFGTKGFAGTVRASVSEGTLNLPENNLALQGIDCTVELPKLPELVSSPSQRCTAGAIDIGKLHFSDTAVTFRIEDRQTLFIEESRTSWCRGIVETGGLRLSASKPEIDTTLYCSLINLAELLNQFGLDQTRGQGTLNGKLPIQLSEKGLRFTNGFLFSTPGTGGIVRFTNTDMLRRGMADVGEAGYVDYSLKALEDFAYDWTRLSFNTEGDTLLLAMDLEGKPRTPLPFGFKDGQIVETGKGEGLQHPIRLDVNFRLPLARLFRVGRGIKALMENQQ